ncbi:hypothetical protein LP420_11510 [Massilia sp. B-10]|nr:hypothetical protein LP420_11510 [Massilia sp. B-10]
MASPTWPPTCSTARRASRSCLSLPDRRRQGHQGRPDRRRAQGHRLDGAQVGHRSSLSFIDEADAVNQVMPELRAKGAQVFVLMIHEGGSTKEQFDKPECSELKGPIIDIARRLDPAIRLIVSGHTHKGFQCVVEGRTVTQAAMGGHVLTRIKMLVDPVSADVRSIKVRNVVVKPGQYPPDEKVSAYLAQGARAAPRR